MAQSEARRAAEQFNGRPAYVALDFAMAPTESVGASLTAELGCLANADVIAEIDAAPRRRDELLMAYGYGPGTQEKPFAYADGVAIIPVHGVLLNRFAYSWGFVTGYNFIQSQLAMASADKDVTTIVLDVCSYGGMVAGCQETAEAVYKARDKKKIVAVVDACAASAAYWVASAANRVVITPTGMAGSIGAVATHVSIAAALEQEGVKVSLIYAGARKVDRYPYIDLTPQARAEIQAEVDSAYDSFVSAVAHNRKMPEATVRATEARMYTAQDALAAGLVDSIMPPTQALAECMIPPNDEDINAMTEAELQAMLDNARAEGARSAQTAADSAIGDERTRIASILGCAEAKDRPALAQTLATTTALPLAEAQRILASAAVETKADPANPFDRAMDRSGNPKVGADNPDNGDDKKPTPKAEAGQLLAALNRKIGSDYKIN